MIKSLKIVAVLLGVALIAIIGCSGDRGPAGPAGTTECMQCHSDDSVIRAIDAQWSTSKHASGDNTDRNSPPCSRCHTGNGFINYISAGVIDTAYQPSPITCFTCHEPHESRNFNLRTDTPVSLELGGTFDYGEGNLCANCHMGRAYSPSVPAASADTIRITSSRWGPHHGPQSDVLSGQNAYEFEGTNYSVSPHTNVVTNGCPSCHMAEPVGEKAGGHTWRMAYEFHEAETEFTAGCLVAGCHFGQANFTFNYRGYQDSVAMALSTLEGMLIADSLISSSTFLVRTPITMTAVQAGAILNYNLFKEDRSLGVHNSRYALDALNASITALGSR